VSGRVVAPLVVLVVVVVGGVAAALVLTLGVANRPTRRVAHPPAVVATPLPDGARARPLDAAAPDPRSGAASSDRWRDGRSDATMRPRWR
jgi:hypothetical protein